MKKNRKFMDSCGVYIRSKLVFLLILAGVLFVSGIFSACSNQSDGQGDNKGITEETGIVEQSDGSEEETNQDENKEQISNNSKRIVNLSPPLFSVLCMLDAGNQVVGTNPRTFTSANENIMEIIYPEYKNINVDFVDADFRINKESLLKIPKL